MKIQPLKDNVLVRFDKPKTQTRSGILLAEQWQTQQPTGTVEAVGPKVTITKPGDRIFFNIYASTNTPEDELRLINQDDVKGILND